MLIEKIQELNSSRKSRKSQSAIEFVILVAFVLFFFTMFFISIQGNMSEKIWEKNNLLVKQTALAVKDEIELAFEASDGYHRDFRIPDTLAGRDYEINLEEGMAYLRTTDGKYAIALPVQKVSGRIAPGSNSIRKENGEVYVNSS